jgi:hypothetical protein
MSEKREITKPAPFTWMVQDNGTKEVFQSDPDEKSVDPKYSDAFPVWNAPQVEALVDIASELLDALIALHAVASVECDEDYAAVTNAAAVIAKATGA